MDSRLLGALAIIGMTVSLPGCGAGSSRSGNIEARAKTTMWSHGESVFRLQNEQMDRLIAAELLLGDDSPGRSAVLFAAEDRIVTSCHALNAAASSLAAGGSVDVDAKVRVLLSLPGCEAAARTAKSILEQDARSVVADLH